MLNRVKKKTGREDFVAYIWIAPGILEISPDKFFVFFNGHDFSHFLSTQDTRNDVMGQHGMDSLYAFRSMHIRMKMEFHFHQFDWEFRRDVTHFAIVTVPKAMIETFMIYHSETSA
jgi:hypothetical protein